MSDKFLGIGIVGCENISDEVMKIKKVLNEDVIKTSCNVYVKPR